MKKSFFAFSSLVCFSLLPELLLAFPKDPSVVSGDVLIQQQTARKMVVHASDRAIIDYKSFDLRKGEKVQFIQPSSSSTVLNRVRGTKASKILGKIESNGTLVLVNPHGMYFGPHASVKAANLIASSLDISNEDFLQGRHIYRLYEKNSRAEIRNDGLLASAPEGSIVLMSPIIRNFGKIQAKAGKVVLAAGEEVTLDFHGDKLLQFAVNGDIKGAIIEHLGEIDANGGEVAMRLPTAKRAIHEVINHEGIEKGEVFVEENGAIFLMPASSIRAKMISLEAGSVSVDGSIDASSDSDRGGEVRINGAKIALVGAKIDASGFSGGGDVFIGGEYQGGGSTPYALSVSMDETSHILANAIEEGQGGNVVLWSVHETEFDGSIFAQGGFQSGNGGVVETSSIGDLSSMHGYVNTSAPNGKFGQWLLDPSTLNIVAGGASNPGCSGGTIGVNTITASTTDVNLCSNTINETVAITMTQTGAGLIFTAPQGETGILNLQGNITTIGGPVVVQNLATTLINSISIDTTNGGAYPTGGNITMLTIDGTTSGGQSFSLDAGQQVINITDIGHLVPLGTISISARQAYMQDAITDSAPIIVRAPIVLTDNSIFNTTKGGGSIIVETVDAILAGNVTFTVNAGTGPVVILGIGTNTALGDVMILSAAPLAQIGNIFTQEGIITIIPTVQLTQARTAIRTFSDLNTLLSSDIMLGDVQGSSNLTQSLDIRGGLKGKVIIGNVGSEDTYLEHVIITANQPMHIGTVYADDLIIVGASGIINLDGPVSVLGEVGIAGSDIIVGASIDAFEVDFKARDSILNNPNVTPTPVISVSSPGTITLNAGRGTVGTTSSPIDVDTQGTVFAGGQEVYVTGTYGSLEYISGNRPCLISFRHRLLPCNLAGGVIFPFLPKATFASFFFNPVNKLGIGYPPLYRGPQFSPFGPLQTRTDYRFPYIEPGTGGAS